ncbi:MAG: hypothetical protein QG597_5063, partial [Actinomycetota bacterium]|nr:hypothetical protein [Actinomycetota bacterium]
AAWAGCASWAGAQAELAVARVAGPAPEPDPSAHNPTSKPTGNIAQDATCASVGAALGVTPYAAMNRIADARTAATAVAPVTVRVLAGTWTRTHLWYAGRATAGHREALAAAAVAAACATEGADRWTPARLGRRIKDELVRLDSEAVAKRIRARRHERGARLDPEDELRGRISVEGSWETMSWAFRQFRRWAETERDRLRQVRKADPSARFCCPEAMARLLAHAHSGRGSSGGGAPGGAVGPDGQPLGPTDACPFCGQADTGVPSLSALTADAVIAAAGLLAAGLGDQTGDMVPTRGKRWRYAAVVVDLPTLAGLANNPGHVPGYGPVPAAIARELAANAPAWRRFLTDRSGVLLDAGADSYRPSDRLREHVTARDWTCTFPGCGRSACDADLDHIDNYDGTNSTASNLHPLCRTHHRVKTHTDWTPQRRPDGTTIWTSPDGHTYTSQPETPWCSCPTGTDTSDGADDHGPARGDCDPGDDHHRPVAPRIETHWGSAPTTPAEHRLATLLADPRTPPARAP